MPHVHVRLAGMQRPAQERYGRNSQPEIDPAIQRAIGRGIGGTGAVATDGLVDPSFVGCDHPFGDRFCDFLYSSLDRMPTISTVFSRRVASSIGGSMLCRVAVGSFTTKAVGPINPLAGPSLSRPLAGSCLAGTEHKRAI